MLIIHNSKMFQAIFLDSFCDNFHVGFYPSISCALNISAQNHMWNIKCSFFSTTN